jgi:hypothetical protein
MSDSEIWIAQGVSKLLTIRNGIERGGKTILDL